MSPFGDEYDGNVKTSHIFKSLEIPDLLQSLPDAELFAGASRNDGVLPESHATQSGVHSVEPKRPQGFEAAQAGVLVGGSNLAACAGLDQTKLDLVRHQSAEMVLVVGTNVRDHHIRAKPIHRKRLIQSRIQVRKRGFRDNQNGKSVGELGPGRDAIGKSCVAAAPSGCIEANEPQAGVLRNALNQAAAAVP